MLARAPRSGKHTAAEQGKGAAGKFRMNSPRCATLDALTTGNAMKRLAALALTAVTALLGGCVTYDDYAYHDRYYADEYYGDRYVSQRYYYDEYGNRVYINDYDVGRRYGYGYGPDYLIYNTYYSALWPTYRYYYDPFWSPGFYYGVTYFPRTYFGLNVGWYSWPYYQAYSPYRYSHADHYYDWWDNRSRDRASHMQDHGHLPRYGSARNEAQYLARSTGARGAAQNYYGASTQPGGIVDPIQARQTRARGGALPFERSNRDWDIQPYGADGRGYGGFTGHGTQAPVNARGQLGRGGAVDARGNVPMPQDEAPVMRSQRGYDRRLERNDGFVAPAPSTRSLDRGGRMTSPGSEYDTSSRQIVPRQTREPYNPVFERHIDETPQVRSQPQFEPRSREPYRNREIPQRPAYQPSMPIERSAPRTFERSEPTFQRSEPSYQRSAPSYPRSEPRAQPSFEPRSAPSGGGYDSGRGSSGSSSDDGGGRSSRGQLERIIRDDD